MTIAAGFRCVDGVLLAADTEITLAGIGKTHRKKIFAIHINNGCCFTYAGTPDFAKELEMAADTEAKTKSGEALLQAIRHIHEELMHKHFTAPPKSEKTFADVLVTARVNGQAVLYSAQGRHFARVDRYLVFGIGEHLGEALFEALYDPLMTISQAAFMCIYALRRAKGFVQGVGGDTNLLAVPDEIEGIQYFSQDGIKRVEDDYDSFDVRTREVLLSFPDLDMEESQFSARLKSMEILLKHRRKQNIEKREERSKRLGGMKLSDWHKE
jgi:20S proteasome alpha/beta subunit